MAASPVMSIGMILLSMVTGPFLGNVLDAPPHDLAALLDPQTALVTLGCGTSEADLIRLLTPGQVDGRADAAALQQAVADLGAADFRTRQEAQVALREAGPDAVPLLKQAAQSPDPEVRITARDLLRHVEGAQREERQTSTTYAQKLYAIRLLAQRKTKNALPALAGVAKGKDAMLARAAAAAAAEIEGKEMTVPSAETVLRDLCRHVPGDTGFLVAFSLAGPDNGKTLAAYVQSVKDQSKDGQSAAMIAASLDGMASGAQAGILKMLNTMGNIRVDGGVVAFADSLGVRHGMAPVVIAVRGLHDPVRLHRTLAESGWKAVDPAPAKTRIAFRGGDIALCSVDPATVIVATGGGDPLAAVVRCLNGERGGSELAEQIRPAVDTVVAGTSRFAAAGALSGAQRDEVGRQLVTELDRCRQRLATHPQGKDAWSIELAALEMVAELKDCVRYSGNLTRAGRLTVDAVCADAAGAASLAGRLEGFVKSLREEFVRKQATMPQAVRPISAQITADDAWRVSREGDRVTIDTICLPFMFLFGIHM